MTRRSHLAEARAKQAELDQFGRKIGLGGGRLLWRSWIRHPLSNARWFVWHTFPHVPKWELSEWSYGEVNHSRATAEGGGVFDRCRRCGVEQDYRAYAPLEEP